MEGSEVTSNGARVALMKFELHFLHIHRHVLEQWSDGTW